MLRPCGCEWRWMLETDCQAEMMTVADGPVVCCTGRPRGFGFVVFEDPAVADKVVSLQHTIDRRDVSLTIYSPAGQGNHTGWLCSSRRKEALCSTNLKAFTDAAG